MHNTTRAQPTGLSLELFHVQTNTSFDLPLNFTVLRIGKPKDQIAPDINVVNLPNADFVSRLHAELHVEKGTYYLLDMNSANGTFVNSIRLKPGKRHKLNFGDKIDLGSGGNVTFLFLNKQTPVVQSEQTALNHLPTVIQVELLANSKPSLVERSNKFAGVMVMLLGVVILAINIPIGIKMRLPGVILCAVAVGALSLPRINQNVGWLLMGLGISIMLFTEKAFAPIPLLAILAGSSLIIAGYRLYTSEKLWNFSFPGKMRKK
ncbi:MULTISPECIES: FHA domain-containing protein [Nostocales]|uniref:FHA domain-containing protein n=3 Tax=Nostocales TaxID=1161 RepID=A0A0C1RJ56_9CYAN|nr:FHA domain-containing protein [Tolypothrix bouteillei]KAF3890671.1 FHA domain-containing protein [Tolypothrix bouteillei VB521301]